MANPNPKLENLSPFTTDKEESCTVQMNVRVPPSLIAKIKQKENWQEFVRQTLQKALEAESA
jgi:predicted DNA binding CopG/RHH family protein